MTLRQVEADQVIVGSYSLETLTTGMYENPMHCVREYVQNAHDAIRAARAAGLIGPDQGLVTITISGSAKRPTLSVRDTGTGVPLAEAVQTLVSIGASKKRSNLDAGFRGIGRLAGIAYCTTLRITTKAKGEAEATIVEFDCGRMRSFMRPSADVQEARKVIRSCSASGTRPMAVDAHWTEVEMVGLTGVGLEFAEIEKLVPYLRQVCPADYSDRFSQAPRIRAFAESIGHPITTVEVETRYKRERTHILKAYDDATPTSDPRRPSTVSDVELIVSGELGWHGWVGSSNFKGELTDDMVAGVRFRVKNIQIDGSDLIQSLGAELTRGATEGRLQRYAVGEIFITNPAVIPNGRRDGFEDGEAWRAIREDVKQKVARRVVTLVRAASKSRTMLASMPGEIAAVAKQLEERPLRADVADRVAATIERLLGKLMPDKSSGGDPNEVGGYISRLKGLREQLATLRPRTQARHESGNEVVPTETVTAGHGEEPRPERASSEDPVWSADELLEALRRIMIQELGDAETERLFNLAREHLAGG